MGFASLNPSYEAHMNFLSIQSHVAYGHVGNSAAVFALQRLGCEVWPVHTVQFSNHLGYGQWRGSVFDAAHVGEVVRGIAERGALARCDGVLSGYLGAADIGAAVLDAVALTKAANPQARYCCDPVIGDVGPGEYVRAGIAEFLRERALPAADVITPNQFELERLSGQGSATRAAALAAAETLRARGPRAVLVTSLHTAETPPDAVDVLACDNGGRFLVRTPLLPTAVNGAGDAAAALFFFHYLRSGLAEALASTVSSIFGLVRRTAEAGTRELLLIEAQEELVAPSRTFRPEPV
jgi:pyridoxine kinase